MIINDIHLIPPLTKGDSVNPINNPIEESV